MGLNFSKVVVYPTISSSRALSIAFKWYTMETIRHLHFLSRHTRLKACVYSQKIQMTRGI